MSTTFSGAFEREPSSPKEKVLKLILQEELKWFCSEVTNLKKRHRVTDWVRLLFLSQLILASSSLLLPTRQRLPRFPDQPLGGAAGPVNKYGPTDHPSHSKAVMTSRPVRAEVLRWPIGKYQKAVLWQLWRRPSRGDLTPRCPRGRPDQGCGLRVPR